MASSSVSNIQDSNPLLSSDDENQTLTKEDSQNSKVVICSFKPTYRLYSRRWFILVAYCMLTVSALSQWFAFTAISSILQKYYRVNLVAINWLSMIYELIFIPFAIPFSFMLGKCGLGFTMVVAAFLNSIGGVIRYVGGVQPDGFWFLFIGHTAGGLSTTAYLFLPPRIAAIWFGETERAMATGIAVAADALGMAIGYFQSAAMVRNHEDVKLIGKDLNKYLLSVSIQSVITFIFVCIVVRDRPSTPPSLSEAASIKQYGSLGTEVPVHDNHAMEECNTCDQKNIKIDDETSVSILQSCFKLNEERKNHLHENNSVTWNCKISSPQMNDLTASINDDENKKMLSNDNHDHANVITIISFKNNLIALMKNTGFELILHIHAIAWMQEIIWQTLLNEIFILKFPGMELQIGLVGSLAQFAGMLSNLAIGPILSKYRAFRKITISIYSISFMLMVIFVIIFNCAPSFYWLSGLFCSAAGLSSAYFTIAFDHAAELTYPIPEGSSGVIVVLVGQVYGLLFANITSLILFKMGPNPVFVILCLLYVLAVILALPLKDKGPRSSIIDAKSK